MTVSVVRCAHAESRKRLTKFLESAESACFAPPVKWQVPSKSLETPVSRERLGSLCSLSPCHPGVLAAKVRHFGSNLLKCSREQIGTKPAKVGHLAGLPI